MSFFHRSSPEEKAARQAAEELAKAEISQLESGGIPIKATERLNELAAGNLAFTSDLTVKEFLMLREQQIEPITQVMGSSIYHIGYNNQYQTAQWYNAISGELKLLTAAWNDARDLAVSRLRQEAELARADAVAGVHIKRAGYDWGRNLIEYITIGTAVRAGRLKNDAGPALTNLSGQEVSLLLRSGYQPLGLVGSSSVYWGQLDYQTRLNLVGWGRNMVNFEFTELAQAWYEARDKVLLRMKQQANALGADGIVGVTWSAATDGTESSIGQDPRGYGGGDSEVLMGARFTVHALGTAIRQIAAGEDSTTYTVFPM